MTLVEAVKRYQAVLAELDDLAMQAQKKQDERDYLLQNTIPELLHESGQSSCALESGEKVSLETVWNVEVPKGSDGVNDYGPIATWLREKGFDAIIQDQVKVQKGADISDFLKGLDARGIGYGLSSSVHWMSLRKVLREHMETGGDAPPETAAKIRVFEQAKIKD